MVDRRGPYRPPTAGRREASGYGADWPAEPERKPIRKGRWIAGAVALAAVAGGIGAGIGLSNRSSAPQWQAGDVAAAVAPVLASLGNNGQRPSAGGVAAMLDPMFTDGRLGAHVTASVIDVDTGETLYGRDGGGPTRPASTAKLLTAAAVLHAVGPSHQIATRAVAGSNPGEVVLIGAGDPTLAGGVSGSYAGAARLDDLAGKVKAALGGQAPTKVIVDGTLYSGPTSNPQWHQGDVGLFISNVTALMTDAGRKNPAKLENPSNRFAQPDLTAGQQFAAALGLPASAVSLGSAPSGGRELAEVLSLPISRQVEIMLSTSDNDIAEGMARQVALAKGKPASFDGGRDAVTQVLGELGLSTTGLGLVDGSGLSDNNKVSTDLLTAVLAKATSADAPELRSIVTGLPVAGYSGSLDSRYRNANAGASAAGVVRAKTGTLTNASSLAGLAVDRNGRLLAFAIVADQRTDENAAEAALDKIAAAIAGCGCS